MNVRPKFHAWLKNEVEFHEKTPFIEPEELEELSRLLKKVEAGNPELCNYYYDKDGKVIPGTRPNEPLRKK